ncbi:hypothetical protein EV424DRAFT_1349620 [Suillus variegatus]|nr:hypothetical protein EV424DRAFT_1349620 [Suillus variegatus]
MSNMLKGINAMPGANSSKAPMFNGETSELLEFFELFEDLALACGLSDAEKCKTIVRYVDIQTKHFWVTLTGYESKDFTVFKTSILSQYSGAAKGLRYSIRDLEQIVISNVDNDISTKTKLLQYYRQFRPVAHWLVTNNKISARERDRYFWQGLLAASRRAIDRRLELKDPANYSRTEATDFEEVLKAEYERYGKLTLRLILLESKPQYLGTQMKKRREKMPEEKFKRNDLLGTSSGTSMGTSKDSPTYKSSVDSSSVLHSSILYSPTTTSLFIKAQTSSSCFFCGGPHIICNCATAGEYLRAGHIICEGNYFLFPDRSRIRCSHNKTICQAIDARYALAKPTTPATGANLITIGEKSQHNGTSTSNVPSSAFISESYFLQCVPMAENHAVVITMEEEEDPVETPEVLAITRSMSKVLAAEQESSKTNAPSTHDITPSTLPSSITSVQTKRTPPAFTYESKAASPETARRVFKSVLEMMVPNLTISDLLAISPDLRKEAVEYCKVQRVPTPRVSLTTNVVTTPAPLQIEHTVPLRELCVTLNGVHSELGLLDEGSEIIVIREDVWRKTNAPRNQGIRMRMQTANGGAQEMGGTTVAKTRLPIQE